MATDTRPRRPTSSPEVTRRLHLSLDRRKFAVRAAIICLFSWRVVNRSVSDKMAAQLGADALSMAIWRRGKPDALLHHPDQGQPIYQPAVQRLIAVDGVTCSMSRSATSVTKRRRRASSPCRKPGGWAQDVSHAQSRETDPVRLHRHSTFPTAVTRPRTISVPWSSNGSAGSATSYALNRQQLVPPLRLERAATSR